MDPKTKEELDNHSNQLNPNNDAYQKSRGNQGGDGKPGNPDKDESVDDNESFQEEWIPQDAW